MENSHSSSRRKSNKLKLIEFNIYLFSLFHRRLSSLRTVQMSLRWQLHLNSISLRRSSRLFRRIRWGYAALHCRWELPSFYGCFSQCRAEKPYCVQNQSGCLLVALVPHTTAMPCGGHSSQFFLSLLNFPPICMTTCRSYKKRDTTEQKVENFEHPHNRPHRHQRVIKASREEKWWTERIWKALRHSSRSFITELLLITRCCEFEWRTWLTRALSSCSPSFLWSQPRPSKRGIQLCSS